jgi:hypothetical protein
MQITFTRHPGRCCYWLIKKEVEQLVHSHIAMTLAGLHLLNLSKIV